MQPAQEEAGYEDVEYVEEVVYEEVSDEAELDTIPEPPATHQPAPATATSTATSQHVGTTPDPEAAADTAHPPHVTSAAVPAAPLAAVEASSSSQPQPGQATREAAPGDFQGVEQSAAKVAQEVQAVAAKLSHSLLTAWQGSSPATSSSPAGAAAAPSHPAAGGAGVSAPSPTTGLSALTGSISSWWSNLDASLAAAGAAPPDTQQQQQRGQHSPGKGASNQGSGSGRLALGAGEHLLESYPCALAQLYGPSANTLTPPVEVLFPGTLHITGSRSLFEAGNQPPRTAGPAPAPQPAAGAAATATATTSSSTAGPPSPAAAVLGAMPPAPWWVSIPHSVVAGASHGRGSRRHHRADQLQLAVTGRVGMGGTAAQATASAAGGGSSGSSSIASGPSPPAAGGQQAVVVFTEFEASGLDDALSLIEHCREEGAGAAPDQA